MKTLKERVLAKCEGLVNSVSNGIWQDDKVTVFKKHSYRVESHDDTIRMNFDATIPETDPVWPLAAHVLGVGVEKSPHRKATEQLVMTPKTDGFSLTIDVRGKESPFSHHHAIGSIRELTGMALEMGQYVPIKGISIAKEVIDAFAEYWNSEGSVPITRLHNAVKALGLCGLDTPNESPKPDWVKGEIKEMMRPSDGLLETAFRKGFSAGMIAEGRRITDLEGHLTLELSEWLQTIPPDNVEAEMRPTKSTLEQAYWAGGRDQQRWNFLNQVPEYGTSRFLDWLETVPKDPLKEDRELVKRYLSHEFWMGNGYLTIQVESFTESVALSKALKRLCGMEVGA